MRDSHDIATSSMLFASDSHRPVAAPADLLLHHTFVAHIKNSLHDDPGMGQQMVVEAWARWKTAAVLWCR